MMSDISLQEIQKLTNSCDLLQEQAQRIAQVAKTKEDFIRIWEDERWWLDADVEDV